MFRRFLGLLLSALMIWYFCVVSCAAAPPEYYLVGLDGYVAVITREGLVYCVTDTPITSLLPADQETIRRGFPCADRAALNRALENFCS